MRRKIALCDDEPLMLERLTGYLMQLQDETGDSYDLLQYNSAEDLLNRMPMDMDVIMLDIAMGNMTGMDCARALRARGCKAAIIFITSMTEYAIEGYDVHAFAFIPKPAEYEELKTQLLSCFARMAGEKKAVLSVEAARGTEILPIEEILYAEVYQHETSFVLADKEVTGSLQLSQVEKQLVAHGFFRTHRSYIVNLLHVRRIDSDSLTIDNGASIPLSRHRRKAFLDAFANFMGGRFA